MLNSVCKNSATAIGSFKLLPKRCANVFLCALHENVNISEENKNEHSVALQENPVNKTSISEFIKHNTSLTPTEITDYSNKYLPGVFAYYIKKSETLQELFRLGVNLHKIEENSEATHFILCSTLEDIRKPIEFLKDLSVDDIGKIITKNPLILKEDLENLLVRVNYLKFKKFSNKMVTRIVQDNPFWLSHR